MRHVAIGSRNLVRFPKLVGRSYGFRTLPLALAPGRPDASSQPMPLRGSQPDEISERASRLTFPNQTGSPGRAFLGRTEDGLNLGPVPSYIKRFSPTSNAGKIGREMHWPYDGNAINVPHQPIPRKPITGTLFVRSIDTGVTIPALPIGAPVR